MTNDDMGEMREGLYIGGGFSGVRDVWCRDLLNRTAHRIYPCVNIRLDVERRLELIDDVGLS